MRVTNKTKVRNNSYLNKKPSNLNFTVKLQSIFHSIFAVYVYSVFLYKVHKFRLYFVSLPPQLLADLKS